MRLRLFDGFEGNAHWTRDLPAAEGAEVRLLGADGLLGVAGRRGVAALSPADGGALRAAACPAAPATRSSRSPAGGVALVRIGGTLTALDTGDRAARSGRRPALGLPSAPEPGADPADALLVPDGRRLRPPGPGHRRTSSAGRRGVRPARGRQRPSSVGDVVVHRLADRVLGYR